MDEKTFEIIEQFTALYSEVRDRIPVSVASPIRDAIAALVAATQSPLRECVFPGPRCSKHQEWPKCVICGEEIKPTPIGAYIATPRVNQTL